MAWYRHPGVIAGAALAVVLLATLALPALTGSEEPQSGIRVDQSDESVDQSDETDADTDTDTRSDEEPAGLPPAEGMAMTTFPRVAWPFTRSELVVFTADDVDADEREGLARDLAAGDVGEQMRVLGAAQVADRVGEAQAARLRSRGVGGAILIELHGGGHRARQAAEQILPTHDREQFGPDAPTEPPEHPYDDPRIAGTTLPECRELARGAAVTGVERAQPLLDDAHCDDDLRVVAAGPQAEEPWVVIAQARSRPPENTGEQVGPGMSVPEPVEVPCLDVFTVRATPGERCPRGQGDGFDGLVGTRWDRNPSVLAGVAPEGTDRVTAAGGTLALVDGPGDTAVFAGALAEPDKAVTLRALNAQGRVLDERTVTPRDLASADRRLGMPSRPPGLSGPDFLLADGSWAFERVDEAVVVVNGLDEAAVEAVRGDLEDEDAVTDVERVGPEQLAETVDPTSSGGLSTRFPTPIAAPDEGAGPTLGLRATTTGNQEARWLATFAERHEVLTVFAPTCEALPVTAISHGVDHANGLLADAGCEDVTVLDAGDEPYRLGVAMVNDERSCTFARLGPYRQGRACRSSQDSQPLRVRAVRPEDFPPMGEEIPDRQLAHGLVPAAADTVELRVGEQSVSLEPVPVTDELGAFTALFNAGGAVEATARDAAGEVLAEADSSPLGDGLE